MNVTRGLTFTPQGYYEALGTKLDAHAYRGSGSHLWFNGWIRNTGAGVLYVSFMSEGASAPTADTAKESVAAGADTFFERINLDSVYIRSADAGVSGQTVADQTARLALTNVVKYYVVLQTSGGHYWQFTGTDSTNNAHWTDVGTTLTAVGFELHGTPE